MKRELFLLLVLLFLLPSVLANCDVPRCSDGWDNDNDNRIDYFGGCDEDKDGFVDFICFCDINGDGLFSGKGEIASSTADPSFYINCLDNSHEYGCITGETVKVFDTSEICTNGDMYWPDLFCTSEKDNTEKTLDVDDPPDIESIAILPLVESASEEAPETEESAVEKEQGFNLLEPILNEPLFEAEEPLDEHGRVIGLVIANIASNKITSMIFTAFSIPSIIGWQVRSLVTDSTRERIISRIATTSAETSESPNTILASGLSLTPRCNDGWDNNGNNRMDYLGGCDNDMDGWRDYICGCDLDGNKKINNPDEVRYKYNRCVLAGNEFGCIVNNEFTTAEQCYGGVMYFPEPACSASNDDSEKLSGIQLIRTQLRQENV